MLCCLRSLLSLFGRHSHEAIALLTFDSTTKLTHVFHQQFIINVMFQEIAVYHRRHRSCSVSKDWDQNPAMPKCLSAPVVRLPSLISMEISQRREAILNEFFNLQSWA